VTSAIRFDDESLLFAEEVDNERAERLLPTELRAFELAAAKPSPQLSFRGSFGATQGSCASGEWTHDARHP
jgi:hypothetical protein